MFLDELKKQKEKYQSIIDILGKKKHKNLGKIHASVRRNYLQYSYMEPGSDRYKYLRNDDIDIAREIVQQEYDEDVLAVAKETSKRIEKLEKYIKNKSIEDVFSHQSLGRKKLIKPWALPFEEYAKNWLNEDYEKLKSVKGERLVKNIRGQEMRSKSEVIISDILNELGIPFKHDYPIALSNGGTRYVDFAVLNKETCKVKYYEHFGLTNDPDYVTSMLRKIEEYGESGLILGDNFFFTYEIEEMPLNTDLIRKIITANCC